MGQLLTSTLSLLADIELDSLLHEVVSLQSFNVARSEDANASLPGSTSKPDGILVQLDQIPHPFITSRSCFRAQRDVHLV